MIDVGGTFVSHIRVKSIVVNTEVFDKYDMNPFTAKSPIGVPIKLLIGIFVALHFFVGLFYFNEEGVGGNWVYWLFKIPLVILGYGFGLFLIPVQIITVPFVLIYLGLSKEKENDDWTYWQ